MLDHTRKGLSEADSDPIAGDVLKIRFRVSTKSQLGLPQELGLLIQKSHQFIADLGAAPTHAPSAQVMPRPCVSGGAHQNAKGPFSRHTSLHSNPGALRICSPSRLALFPVLPAATFAGCRQADVVDRRSGPQETVAGCFVKPATGKGQGFLVLGI